MSLLNSELQEQVRQALAAMTGPVKVVLFTQGADNAPGVGALECDYCTEARQLIEEVAALSDRIALEVRDLMADAPLAAHYHIDKIPALAILADGPAPKDYGIRLYGVPAGYEFSTLIEDLLLVSRRETGLSAKTIDELKRLTQPVHIQVYVTPTCPYCPRAVVLAHRLALASDLITADMVEANEFPHLSNKYQVYGVPRTVIDDVLHVEGALPETALVTELLKVLDTAEMQRLRTGWEAALN
ncbi:MAG: thioredoxin family protein [Chloroflexi bacterium]|nr:thioredoxin family protein [Chloroflexota bacterium]